MFYGFSLCVCVCVCLWLIRGVLFFALDAMWLEIWMRILLYYLWYIIINLALFPFYLSHLLLWKSLQYYQYSQPSIYSNYWFLKTFCFTFINICTILIYNLPWSTDLRIILLATLVLGSRGCKSWPCKPALSLFNLGHPGKSQM